MDVDIDFPTNFDPLDHFPEAVRASRVERGQLTKHPAGVYFQHIPKDTLTGLAAIPYEQAEGLGYFKVDFLHLSVMDDFAHLFKNKSEMRSLVRKDPDWALLQVPSVVQQLFQLGKHHDLVMQVRPNSVLELADCIALIRPHGKRLLTQYIQNPEATRTVLYSKPEDGRAYYKKPHSIAYALVIVLQLHLIKARLL